MMDNMPNIPDIRYRDRHIPEGKILVTGFGERPDSDERPERTVLDVRRCFNGRTRVTLEAVTAGWAIAGSAMRWDNGHFAVRYVCPATDQRWSHNFRTLVDALEKFRRLPD